MRVVFRLGYVHSGIFDLSRWDNQRFVPEFSSSGSISSDSKICNRHYVYSDGLVLDLIYELSDDGYGEFQVTVMSNGIGYKYEDISLYYEVERPAVLDYRYFDSYVDTMSLSGGIAEELCGYERGFLIWEQDAYQRQTVNS